MDHKSRRILIFSTAYLPFIGGAELALKEITDRIKDIDFDLISGRIDKTLPKQEKIGNVRIFRVGGTRNIILPKNTYPIYAFLKAVQLSKRGRYDAVFALQASQGGGAAWLFKLFHPKIPFILNMQEGKDLEHQNFLIKFFRGLIIKKADLITVLSIYLESYVKKIVPKKQVEIIPNGVDLNKFSISNFQFPRNKDKKIIITVSRLVKKNGVGDLIDAFNILYTKYQIQNTKLLVIGSGELEKKLKAQTKMLGLENSVSFLGEIHHEELPKYLGQADVFVRPSLSEGLGIAFLEAMASGLPVIATAQGGIVDFLENEKTGLFCNVNDPKDLSDKIMKVLSDNVLAKAMAEKARKLMEDKYDWDKIANRYKQIFVSI